MTVRIQMGRGTVTNRHHLRRTGATPSTARYYPVPCCHLARHHRERQVRSERQSRWPSSIPRNRIPTVSSATVVCASLASDSSEPGLAHTTQENGEGLSVWPREWGTLVDGKTRSGAPLRTSLDVALLYTCKGNIRSTTPEVNLSSICTTYI